MSIWDRLKGYASGGPDGAPQPLQLLRRADFESTITSELGKRLADAGFEKLGKRRWGKAWAPEVNALVALESLKGAFTAAWGVSLPFVPHLTDDVRVGWHRALKDARFDLSYHPRDYEKERSAWTLSQLTTPEELAIATPEFASQVVSGALSFLQPISGINDLLAGYEEKRERPFVQFGLMNYPQELLAHAFVLARCGRRVEAEEGLRTYWARLRQSDEADKIHQTTVDEIGRLIAEAKCVVNSSLLS